MSLKEYFPKLDLRALAAAAHAVVNEPLRPPDRLASGLGRGSIILHSDEWAQNPEAYIHKRNQEADIARQVSEQRRMSEKALQEENMEYAPLPNEPVKDLDNGKIVIDRVPLEDLNGLIGKCYRSPITGSIYLKEADKWRDFTLVDLWTRDEIVGLADDIAKDIHILWPAPLKKRTWIYHAMVRHRQAQNSLSTMDDTIQRALAAHINDDDHMSDGGWSPVVWFAPMLPVVLLASDRLTFLASAALLFICHAISIVTNTYKLWMWSRIFSLPFRLAYLGFVVWRLSKTNNLHVVRLIGFCVPIVGFVIDLVLADLCVLSTLRYRCTFKILRNLPNQVFVCQREGETERLLRAYHERLTGHVQGGGICLIANVQGLLCELIPLDRIKDARRLENDNNLAISEARGRVHFAFDAQATRLRYQAFRMKYYGQDVFNLTFNSVTTMETKRHQAVLMKEFLQTDLVKKLEDNEDAAYRMDATHSTFFGSTTRTRFNFGTDQYTPPSSKGVHSVKEAPLKVEDV